MLAAMTRWLKVSLRDTPAAVPALAAIVLFVVWATSQAGYPLTHWAPGALIVPALLLIALLAAPLRLTNIPLAVKLALACLAAYTALSFLSILWAATPGLAWEGANRTLLYLMVFALFALWPGRGASAALLVGVWTFALIALAVYVAVRVDTATGSSYQALFSGERLSYPVGYPNATAAQWLMAFWPALLLARGNRLPWAVRGLLAAGAVVLADVALLSQSRGSLYSLVPMIVLVFAFVPERLRTFATAVPIALGIGVTAPLVLRVGDRLGSGHSASAATHTAVAAMFLAALLVGVLVGLGGAFESHRSLSVEQGRALRRVVAAIALGTLIAVLAGGLVAAGNPVTRVRHSWESFEGGYSTTSGGDRLLSGLGSNRYDFYRVALHEFIAHPILGIGVDNYQQSYLRLGRSEETPHYPHSVELRTLTQTGLLGALLAVLGLGAALLAGWRAMRLERDPLGGTVAAAALSGFAYWALHGSFDWFWEFAGLGAPAFALLGIACSFSPPRSAATAENASPTRSPSRLLVPALGIFATLAVLSLAAPWLSERQIQSAARIWPKAPLAAYARLEDAAKLNPLSDRAYLVLGSIALRFGDFARAEHAFSRALKRVPDDAYAALELGAIASEAKDRGRALVLLRRAAHLNPRDPLTHEALETVQAGRTVGLAALNRSILLRAQQLN
jgi:tetratricopeptide (TPR) repeat protein